MSIHVPFSTRPDHTALRVAYALRLSRYRGYLFLGYPSRVAFALSA